MGSYSVQEINDILHGEIVGATACKITAPEQLEAAMSSKTKLFMFSSPCNPTGSVYSKEELAGLVEVFKNIHPDYFQVFDP